MSSKNVCTVLLVAGLVGCAWKPKVRVADALDDPNANAYFVNGRSGRCLDTYAGRTAVGVPLIQWGCHAENNMQRHLEPAEDGAYTLVNRKSRKCAQPEAKSDADYVGVVQDVCDGSTHQRWKVEVDDAGMAQLTNVGSGLCMSVIEQRTDDWATVIQTKDCQDLSARWH